MGHDVLRAWRRFRFSSGKRINVRRQAQKQGGLVAGLELGTAVKYKNRSVRYFPFAVDFQNPLILTAEPSAYLTAWLSLQEQNAKTSGKQRYRDALYYANLSEQFQRAAATTLLPAAGTLAYYSVLNLAKCFIRVTGQSELAQSRQFHGLSMAQGRTGGVSVYDPKKANKGDTNAFHEFAAALGTPVMSGGVFDFTETCCHVPELHAIACSLGHHGGGKRTLLPIRVEIRTNDAGNRLFSVFSYELKEEDRVDTGPLLNGPRGKHFREFIKKDGRVYYRSKRMDEHDGTLRSLVRLYELIQRRFKSFGVCSLLTRRGYSLYFDLRDPPFHHLAHTFMLLFYVGSIARYKPREMTKLLTSDLRALAADAIRICPRQFLYHVVSMIAKKACVVPEAAV